MNFINICPEMALKYGSRADMACEMKNAIS
jgi:hypothetical protein